jgi:bilirubin oxidase
MYHDRTVTDPKTNQPIDYFESTIMPFSQKVYPDRAAAAMVGYDGMSPGATYLMTRGRKAVVRYTNNNVWPAVIHNHGQPSVSSLNDSIPQ